ncbi:hypothetical protein J0910_24515 [Nocardiopsis sp. CNT-189]|uniref:hypothetical protein n=1 Tax=Nocardiopsis oceanisediminis TaxID=2816862 RepID=UPI003B318B5E
MTSVAALLFEMRTALQFKDGNAALLVVRNLRSFDWSSSAARTPLRALTALSSTPDRTGNSFHIKLDFHPEAELAITGDLAEFYLLDVEKIGEVPPNYSNTNRAYIYQKLPSWTSACNLLQTSSLH